MRFTLAVIGFVIVCSAPAFAGYDARLGPVTMTVQTSDGAAVRGFQARAVVSIEKLGRYCTGDALCIPGHIGWHSELLEQHDVASDASGRAAFVEELSSHSLLTRKPALTLVYEGVPVDFSSDGNAHYTCMTLTSNSIDPTGAYSPCEVNAVPTGESRCVLPLTETRLEALSASDLDRCREQVANYTKNTGHAPADGEVFHP